MPKDPCLSCLDGPTTPALRDILSQVASSRGIDIDTAVDVVHAMLPDDHVEREARHEFWRRLRLGTTQNGAVTGEDDWRFRIRALVLIHVRKRGEAERIVLTRVEELRNAMPSTSGSALDNGHSENFDDDGMARKYDRSLRKVAQMPAPRKVKAMVKSKPSRKRRKSGLGESPLEGNVDNGGGSSGGIPPARRRKRRRDKGMTRIEGNGTATCVEAAAPATIEALAASTSELAEIPSASDDDDGQIRPGKRKRRHGTSPLKRPALKLAGRFNEDSPVVVYGDNPNSAPLSIQKPKKNRKSGMAQMRGIKPRCAKKVNTSATYGRVTAEMMIKLGLNPGLVGVGRAGKEPKPKSKERPTAAVLAPIARSPSPPLAPGIRSSTFAAVMRLVAGIAPARATAKTKRGPPPAMGAKVWAESRQELCEALPYYRAFQSGMYMYKRVPYGYLLDGFPAPRDMWAADGRVIISHGGGQAVRVVDRRGRSTVTLAADHTADDARIHTLLVAAERHTPIVLLAGEGYALLPFELRSAYAVLGWYWVSAAWYESEPCAREVEPHPDRPWFRRLKVRFDWVDSQGEPWWLQSESGAQSSSFTTMPTPAEDRCAAPLPVKVPISSLLRDTPPPPLKSSETTLTRSPVAPQAGKATHHFPSPPTTPGVGFSNETSREPAPTHIRFTETGHLRFSVPPPTPPKSPELRSPSPSRADLQLKIWETPSNPTPTETLAFPFRPTTEETIITQKGSHGLARAVVPLSADYSIPHVTNCCPSCETQSPVLYQEGWACLHPECKQFWMLATAVGLFPIPPGMLLSYSPAFLRAIPTPPEAQHLAYSVVPPNPAANDQLQAGSVEDQAGSRNLWRGWVCTDCGRANCRYRWERSECRACGLQAGILDLSSVIPADHSRDERDVLGEDDEGWAHLLTSVRRLCGPAATVTSYDLPGIGTVFHIMHDHTNEADRIFKAYQEAAIATNEPLFQRRALKSKTIKGQLLSQQFAINSGAQYKYIVETLSYTFAESPPCVMDALQLIRRRVATVLGDAVDFNEILSVMYREGQKMNWHDDGERGLGPVVAALSLGASATMSFRPKTPHVKRDIQASEKKEGATRSMQPPVLNLHLGHGDVVIMSGRAIQHAYDHRVVPHGLRVAATARVIRDA